MPTTRRPTTPEIRDFLADYGIAPIHLDARVLRGGADNLNILLAGASTPLVLRCYNVTEPAEVLWELELVRFLCQGGFPTPAVVERLDGQLLAPLGGRVAALFRYVPGEHPPRTARWAGTRVAVAVGALHRLTEGFPAPPRRARTDLQRLRQFREAMRATASRDPATLWLLREVEARLAWYDSHQVDLAELPRGVVHHDAHAGNVLFAPNRRLVALLDFDEAYEDCLITDLGRLLRLWGTAGDGGALVASRVWRIVNAYENKRPLSPTERHWLPEFTLLTSLADVAEYATPRLPAGGALSGSSSYATYRLLLSDTRWRGALDPYPAYDDME